MKSDRLMSVLLLLQAHRRLSTREIAERLEISHRTAHRDMESLCMAGVPLVAHRGAQGGWELDSGWKTEVPGLDAKELQSLLLLQPSSLGDRGMTAAAERAYEKLVASLPQQLQERAQAMRTRLHIDATGWGMAGEDLSMLPAVQEAVLGDRRLSFHYTRADGESNARTVDPLGLVCKQTVWYLVARTKRGMRTYRLSRMRDVVVLAMPVKRPKRFDLTKHWRRSGEEFKEKRKAVTATVAMSPEAARLHGAWMTLRPVEREPHGCPAEWRVFELHLRGMEEAMFMMLGFGAQARALAPAELCRKVGAEWTAMSAHYAGLV